MAVEDSSVSHEVSMLHHESIINQQHEAQVSELRADLKSLIELEPYAHRARQIKHKNEERLHKKNLPKAL